VKTGVFLLLLGLGLGACTPTDTSSGLTPTFEGALPVEGRITFR